jgi:hypothetical protein
VITRRTYSVALEDRAELVKQIESFGPHLPFDQCLQLCGDVLKERYLIANRVVCLLEQQALDAGRAYRMRDGKLVWRSRQRA